MKLRKKIKRNKKILTLLLVGLILLLSGWVFLAEGKKIYFLSTQINIQKNLSVSPRETVVLKFSSKFLRKYYENKIQIAPMTNFQEKFSDDNEIILTPEDSWPIGEEIKITLPSGRNFAFFPIKSQSFRFVVSDYPRISYMYPFPGEKDVILGVEDPIEFAFLNSTIGFQITVETYPEKILIIETDEKKKKFKILPQENFSDGERVKMKVFASYAGRKTIQSKKIFEGNFTTLPPYPSEWPQNIEERIREAKRFTQAKIKEGKYIDINLSAQILSIFEEGILKDSFLVSTGKRGMETPRGEYQIYNKFPRPWSKTYSLFMPYWMAITSSGKYGIHELPEWPGGYKEGAGHLGIPVSHGCIRLGIGPAEQVYAWAEVGTKVIIY